MCLAFVIPAQSGDFHIVKVSGGTRVVNIIPFQINGVAAVGQPAITANFGGTIGTSSSMPEPLGDVLDEAYPEITRTVLMSWEMNMVLTHENQAFRSEGRYFGSDFSRYSSFLYWLEIRQQPCWIRNRSRYPNHLQNGILVTTGV